jgi:alkaline phosphatase D
MQLDRRSFIAGAAATVATLRLGAAALAAPARPAAPLPTVPFTLGVASGDPAPDGFVIWTRLAPDPTAGGGMPPEPVAVGWEVATDATFTDVVASGTASAIAELAHTVHVEVTGLEEGRQHWYRFAVEGWDSPVGRARTLPTGSPEHLRFGFVSCQNYASGFYGALAGLADEGCDLWLHLGDYIYENADGGPARSHGPDECVTLAQYRDRYGLYKSDVQLQAAHHAACVIPIWDDHEVDNDYTVVDAARQAAGYRAWFEHQPVRLPAPTGPTLEIFRRFEWGDLATFHMLDGRQHRDPAPCGGDLADCPERLGVDRSLLGSEQLAWLQAGLAASDAVWDVLGQPVVFVPLPFGSAYNNDQWDGYPQERDRVWSALRQRPNPVVVTGDIHAAGVAALHETLGDVTTLRRGTELVGTSVSSRFDPALVEVANSIINSLPWIEYGNASDRGYTVVDLTRERMVATFRVVSTIDEPIATLATAHVAEVLASTSVPTPSGPPSRPEAPAADAVPATVTFTG